MERETPAFGWLIVIAIPFERQNIQELGIGSVYCVDKTYSINQTGIRIVSRISLTMVL